MTKRKSKIDVGHLYTCSEGFKWPTKDAKDWRDIENFILWRRKHTPSMKRWLNAAAYREPVARFLLRYGQHLRPSDEQMYEKDNAGECYLYSYAKMLASMDNKGVPTLKYMIGLAMSFRQPAQLHAWNILAGRAYDTTWHNPHAVKYCGIEIGQDLLSFLDVVLPSVDLGLFINFDKTSHYLANYCLDRERLQRETTRGA